MDTKGSWGGVKRLLVSSDLGGPEWCGGVREERLLTALKRGN